jgi:hypothetical protein
LNVRTKYTAAGSPRPNNRIRSLMEADRLDFNAGAEVTIGIAARRGRLIV